MDFKQIQAFVNVVRCGSFSKAADAMFFSQPTISAHVAALEKELGTELLSRRGRKVEMTAEGKKFYQYAVEMVNIRETAIHEIEKTDDHAGVLSICTSSIPSLVFLPEILSMFHAEHPDIRFSINSSDTGTVVTEILERRGDIGFVGAVGDHAGIDYTEVLTDQMVLVAPASYDIPEEIDLTEAAEYPFVWRDVGSATRRIFEEMAQKRGLESASFNVVAHFSDLDPLIRSVEQGLGMTFLSEYTLMRLHSDYIKKVRVKDFTYDRRFYMIALSDGVLPPAAELFKQFVIENKDQVILRAGGASR